MFYIRADGNTHIGMGHVMRCLSIAEAASKLEGLGAPIFLTADEGCKEMIEDRGFEVYVLHTDFRDMMSELPLLERMFHKERDIMLVDSYQVSDGYFNALKKLIKTACLEDVGIPHPADLLINYNVYGPELKDNYIYSREVLLGTAYMPLREQFQVPSDYQIREQVRNIIVTTGGSDPYFAMDAIMTAALEDERLSGSNIHWHLLSGPFNKYKDCLAEKYGGQNGITIHQNVKDMRSLLLQADIIISATGSTIYEVSSLGIPMIVFYFADNQKQSAEALERLTDIANGGCFAKAPDKVCRNILDAVKKCIKDKAYREALAVQEKALVDGKGAERIALSLLNYLHKSIETE